MKHLIILTLVLNLIAGTAVFFYALGAKRRYRRPFLKTLLAYIISFNGLVIVYFIYQYVMINVFSSDPREIFLHPALFSVLFVMVQCAEFGMTVSLFRLVRHLRGEQTSKTAWGLLVLWGSIFAAGSAYGLVIFFTKTRWLLFYWIHAAWLFSLLLIILGSLIAVLISAKKDERDVNSLVPFARIFIAGYAAFAVSNLDFYFIHTAIGGLYDSIAVLFINLCPLLWLKYYFEKGNILALTGNREEELDAFCEEFGISKREREIITYVILGKSNKDIEKILFISHNTVKNHLYSVYQKAGVSSRSELIYFITG